MSNLYIRETQAFYPEKIKDWTLTIEGEKEASVIVSSSQNEKEKRIFETGNAAFARGLVESKCQFFSYYPGTPISEIADYLSKQAKDVSLDLTIDLSVNETVAFSSALGASWSGVRAAVAFKHLGMNLVSDVLHTAMYSGIEGKRAGLVIICGSDPNCESSTNAQDIRLFSLHSKLPILDAWTIDSCRFLVPAAFALSEQIELPVLIHTTSRLCHASGLVYPLRYPKEFETFLAPYSIGRRGFQKNFDKFCNAIHWAVANQKQLNKKVTQLQNAEKSLFSSTQGHGLEEKGVRLGFISSGLCSGYINELCNRLEKDYPRLHLIQIYPITRTLVEEFMTANNLNLVLIVEELEPFLEIQVKSLLYDAQIFVELHGKDWFPLEQELSVEIIHETLWKHQIIRETLSKTQDHVFKPSTAYPIREPTFCPGCGHRSMFYALRKAAQQYQTDTKREIVFGGDIGCYTLGMSSPYNCIDWLIAMGAGIGISNGVARTIDPDSQHVVALVGDSTFFHTGLQPLINLTKDNISITILILDNFLTAMTGHQLSVSTPQFLRAPPKKPIQISELVQSLHPNSVVSLDAYSIKTLQSAFLRAFAKPGTNILIIEGECALNKKHRLRLSENHQDPHTFLAISDHCTMCNECFGQLGCTAIELKNELLEIQLDRCLGEHCAVCVHVCPNHAIRKTIVNPHKQGGGKNGK